MRFLGTVCVLTLGSALVAPLAQPFPGPTTAPLRELRGRAVLVELTRATPSARNTLVHVGARIVSSQLRVWRVPRRFALRVIPELKRAHLLAGAEPERDASVATTTPFDDPLYGTEWWRAAVDADAATPPQAGIPLTIVDSGVDLSHPEFERRPATTALNVQSLNDTPEDFHGTAVASVAAAPANGVGIVGIYPTAAVRSWDARRLSNTDVIAGILAAAKRGPTVINLSLGYPQPDPMIEQAVLVAFGEGSIIVASAGNDFQNGNPLIYPASLPHVLTVAATDESSQPTDFSSASEAVDLAAPGEHIVAAVPLPHDPTGYESVDGTSFSAPIVSAATAWMWTTRSQLDNTQIFDLMRWSARDIWRSGFDPDTGFGLLDLSAALSATPPPRDPEEPNDDVDEIKAHGLFRAAVAALTHGTHRSAHLTARLDVTEDPVDLYRVWVPAHRTVKVSVTGDDDVDLAAWKPATTSVHEAGTARHRDLLAASMQPGQAAEVLSVPNTTRRGEYVYVEVELGSDSAAASYSLAVSTLRIKS